MCEKPAGVYTKQVREMNEEANKHDLVFGMMFNQRMNPLYQKIKEIMDSGRLGGLRRVTWIITTWWRPQKYYEQSSWRATWQGEGGGVLANQAPHQVDLLQWICGMPDTLVVINVDGQYVIAAYGADDLVETFKDNALSALDGAEAIIDTPVVEG